jgi:WXG100 family type VII secretion target
MAGFDASEQALLAAGSRMSEVEAETRQNFASLRQEAEALLDGGWSGGAARGFARGWRQWEVGFNDCMTALSEMGQLLRLSGEGYGNSEQASVSTIDASGSGLL